MSEFLSLEYISEIVATIFYAISGVRLAAFKRFDWFGAYVIGFVTAFGGGTVRDVLLGLTPFWMDDVNYVIATVVGLAIVILFRKKLVRIEGTFYIFDAFGLALFTDVGSYKALHAGHPFWMAIMMGTITGAMGGVLRDIFINEVPLVFRKEVYATACIIGGVIYWAVWLVGGSEFWQEMSCAVVVIVLRFFAVKYNLSFPALHTGMEGHEKGPDLHKIVKKNHEDK